MSELITKLLPIILAFVGSCEMMTMGTGCVGSAKRDGKIGISFGTHLELYSNNPPKGASVELDFKPWLIEKILPKKDGEPAEPAIVEPASEAELANPAPTPPPGPKS